MPRHPDPAPHDPFLTLNDAQRSAVEHGLDGDPRQSPALLVIAGAGSGKTKTLAARVARLVISGADPQRILLLTFSRRAAAEMVARAGGLLQAALRLPSASQAPKLQWAGTFHGIGARLLREHAARIGLSRRSEAPAKLCSEVGSIQAYPAQLSQAPRFGLSESFTILDRSDGEDLMGIVRHALGYSSTRRRFPMKGTCLAIYSRVVNSQESLREVLGAHYPWCADWEAELKGLFGAYVAEKQKQQVLDYDDLLLYWSQMMTEPALARQIVARFDHVLVDEYQDTNRLQAAILRGLKPDGRGLMVVGDDAQAIYSFRAAEVRNILDFPEQFEPRARVITLEYNYRSTQPILQASNAVMAEASERHTKALWSDRPSSDRPKLVTVEDESAQARWVADRLLEHREQGLKLKSQAVLFRTSHHSAPLELELARRNIPFVKFGGLKFLEAAHIKDVLSVLRWAHNPRNRLAGFRVAQLVAGIGPASVRRLLDAMELAPEPATALLQFAPPAAARDEWQQLRGLIEALREPECHWPAEVELVQRWYLPQLERLHDDARVRQADLLQLTRIAAGYSSRERFLSELALDPPQATSDESGVPLLDEDYVILSTIHSAKGQEWQSVHVLNVVDGCIPADLSIGSAQQIEEERRLLYVAMTRAKQHLHLLVPQRFYVTQQSSFGDRHVYGSLTRFIPASVAATFEVLGPASTEKEPLAAGALEPILDIGARLRSAWG